MNCPRCNAALTPEFHQGIQVDRCLSCNGRWLDHDELDKLEATVQSTPEQREATIQYSQRQSELPCPLCGKKMTVFNYRAHSLEMDSCEDKHGFWLDSGEEGGVRDIIQERIQGLERSASAEAAWGNFLTGLRGGRRSIWDRIGDLFGGGRR